MTNYVALVRRELSVYFVSPMAYIILTAFLVVNGLAFYIMMDWFAASRSPVQFGQVQLVMVNLLTLLTPLVTMRLIAEEKSRGTMETMMTAPVGEWSFVLAKFSAAFLFIGYLLLPTVCYAVLAAKYGTVDFGSVVAGYLGMMLAVAAVLALGVWISAMSGNQITAGVLTLIAALLLMLMPQIGPRLPPTEGFWRVAQQVFEHVNLLGHMESFSRGIVDTRSAVWLGSVCFLFLFVTVRSVESRRWG